MEMNEYEKTWLRLWEVPKGGYTTVYGIPVHVVEKFWNLYEAFVEITTENYYIRIYCTPCNPPKLVDMSKWYSYKSFKGQTLRDLG